MCSWLLCGRGAQSENEMARLTCLLVLGALLLSGGAYAEGVSKDEFDALKKEIEALRQQVDAKQPVGVSEVDDVVDNEFGPNQTATSFQGKLTVGGLVQVWYYGIQNDHHSYYDVRGLQGIVPGVGTQYGSNEVADNDGFALRRAEIRLRMDISENVSAFISLDPAREATSFPTFPTNLGSGPWGDNAVMYDTGWFNRGHPKAAAVRNGLGNANRLLQDAYIKVHGLIPHHEFYVGQMKRRLGYEGTRDAMTLDFVERAMIAQPAALRDMGGMVHGLWWDDRVQYWLGAFDGAGSAFQQRQNRADDNDEKDFLASVLLRPLWKDEKWGSIELGYSILYGTAGEAAGHFVTTQPVDGLNRQTTNRIMQYAYATYRPGGPVKGWWMRGEWGYISDRFAPNQVVGWTTVQRPEPFTVQGWNVATGYKLSDSIWADGLPSWLKPAEFTFRYDVMQNLFLPDLVKWQRQQDVFKTQVFTAGLNYYLKGHNAKFQFNYNWVEEEDDVDNSFRQVREVRNDNFVLSFQVGW